MKKEARQPFAPSGTDLEMSDKKPTTAVRGEAEEKSDFLNICLLLVLYTLQGVPMGLSGAIPFMLQDKAVSYADQSMFSLVSWPFSLKLFWAPIVDTVYLVSFGRRKTWLVPSQLAIGLTMLFLGSSVDAMLSDTEDTKSDPPQVWMLTVVFFWMFFLCATQDIAVDGWAITMLQEKNKGYAATANTVGQTAGYFIAFTGFLALKANDFCTLAQFMNFWAAVFLVTTVMVWFFKTEEEETEEIDGVAEVYGQMYDVINLSNVRRLVVVLFTFKLGFAAADSITGLKLMEYGVPKEHMATMMTLITPFNIAIPIFIGKFIGGSDAKPLKMLGLSYVPRMLVGLTGVPLVYTASVLMPTLGDDEIPWTFYTVCFGILFLGNIIATVMFNAQMSFFARISDPRIGGTYMTLLNTIANLGSKWPSTLVLGLVDPLTTRGCAVARPLSAIPAVLADGAAAALELPMCRTNVSTSVPAFQAQGCLDAGGSCETLVDGYYVLALLCVCAGVGWLHLMFDTLSALESLPIDDWHVKREAATGKRE